LETNKKFFKPKVLFAIAVAVVTMGAATAFIAPAIIASAGVASGSIAASVITGAVAGSAGAFSSSMVMTDGNFKDSLKAAAFGGLTGGISAGVGSMISSSFQVSSNGFQKELVKFTSDRIGDGVSNAVLRKDFSRGFEISALSFAAATIYKNVVGYEVTIESGGEAVQKGFSSPPVKGANNIGTQGEALDSSGLFNEGGVVSRAVNKIAGINAIAGMHDVFQTSLPGVSRDILNIPGMPVAAVFTYISFYNQIQCPYC